jgi:hypothetical protein
VFLRRYARSLDGDLLPCHRDAHRVFRIDDVICAVSRIRNRNLHAFTRPENSLPRAP